MPARSPHPSTYQQPLAALISHPWRLERGAGCPPWGPSPAHSPSRWLLHQHRCASIHRQSKLGRGERDIKGDVTGGVGTSPPQASPSLQEPRGCARLVAPPYLPAGHMGAGLVEDAGPRAGCAGGGFSSCWLRAPPASPTPGTHRSSSSQVFPKKQLKIYPVWTGDLVGSWLPTSRQVGVGGRGQERGSPKLSPSESWSRSGCRTRQRRDWALSGASTGLSCRAGHRWETIAFCPGASHARAAQGG